MGMDIALSTTVRGGFGDVVSRTREALADQGFGVLTEIDMKATMAAKLGAAAGEALGDYLILGACNPPLAQRAVMIDRQIGLLLPCNVVVRSDPDQADTVHVEAMNPQLLVGVTGQAELQPVADEVTARLQSAIDSLSA
ncbi:ABC transporter [Mycolicibacterium helvum]|uniref:ABC transporter n=2 Tax=Mycolicibacterium helvum TaxID=1534349 RepID=A0A7I7T9F1_9MYCO|nr:ABC transporter [Mycolicibacterium helvum]